MQTEDIKPKVLYVDDEEDNLLVFKSSFRRNYHVLTAQSVADALEILKDNPVDIIISDQRMPDVTGVEFLKSLPDEPENIRMLLTGFSDMEAVIDAVNSGKIFRYISKPWEREQVQQIIDNGLKKLQEKQIEKQKMEVAIREKQNLEDAILGGAEQNEDKLKLELVKEREKNESRRKQLEEADKSVSILGKIGQDIISNLDIDAIIDSTYENVNALMTADTFGIGIYNPETRNIEFPGLIEGGIKIPFGVSIDNDDRYAVWCYKNKKEVFINDHLQEYKKYVNAILQPVSGTDTQSIFYLPLMIKENIIGVITVQAIRKHAFTNYHLNILRNIATYVATALENAKAYNLVEEHKKEIERKNVELEQKVQKRTEQLQQKNGELESTYNNVKLLSEIGRQITSTLSLEKMIETVYDNVNALMDATIFTIGIYDPLEKRLNFPLTVEKSVKIPHWFVAIDEEDRLPVWCFINRKEIIINDYVAEFNKYIKSDNKTIAGGDSESLIYVPLMANDEPIGVITVQSFKKHIYNQYHIDILRSLGSYIAIAIQNSNSYRNMTNAFEELKSTQTKLVESEKMASLGVLTAGVAHEINNPVNFISAGVDSLKRNYDELAQLLKKYIDYDPGKSGPESWNEIMNLKSRLAPQDLMPEMDDLFNSIRNGATRTAEIVKGLKNFSRLDENEMKLANVEENLDSTLVILNNQVKDKIEIVREYGNIPEIICYPGQLNQVFMNILHNAIQAIETKGRIIVKTEQLNGSAIITIRDDGMGMSDELRLRIFYPFFTTKAVGKGTGLGLSIAYGIIEKHKGNIQVESEPGKGTAFILTLPLK